jgi:uncharacterized membrane protein YqjE
MDDVGSRSTGELVLDGADDLRMLVRKELELARVELMEGVKAQLKGAGVIAVALIAALPGFLFLFVALALWLPLGAAAGFAVVGGAMLLFTVIGVLAGIRVMKSRKPTVETAVGSIKEDVRWAREQLTR